MSSCGELLTPEDLTLAKQETATITEFVESSASTLITPQLQAKKTLTGIIEDGAAAIVGLGWNNKGEFSTLPTMTDANDVAVFQGNYWLTTESLPYTPTGSSPLIAPEAGKWLVAATVELAGIERGLNVPNGSVQYTTYTGVLDDVKYLYDSTAQVTWGVPALDSAGKTIVSVASGVLTTTGGTGGSSYILETIEKSDLKLTLDESILSTSIALGDSVRITDRADGIFDVVLASTVTPNSFDIVQCSGDASLALSLRKDYPLDIRKLGAKLDGVTDDSGVLQLATVLGDILVNGQCRIATNTGITTTLVFENGGSLAVDSGITAFIAGMPAARQGDLIFGGLGAYALSGGDKWPHAHVDWFNTGDAGPAITKAWAFTDNLKMLSPAYSINTSAIVPQARNLQIDGSGFRTSFVTVAAGIDGIAYQRVEDAAGSVLTIKGLAFGEVGLGKTGSAIDFKGFSAGTPGAETKIQDDNWLRTEDCYFVGFFRSIETKFAGQCHFDRNWYQDNTAAHFMLRGSSFFYFDGCQSLGNGNFINGSDTVADAYSNGLFITNCNSVTNSFEDIILVGWQAVFINGGGFDLGSGGIAALYFDACQDVHVGGGAWVASDITAVARNGVHFVGSRSSTVGKATIVNNNRGVYVISSTGLDFSTITFEANKLNDVLGAGSCTGITVARNKHRTLIPLIGTNAPIYGNVAGNSHWIVSENVLKNAAYSIVIPVSYVPNNLFDWIV